MGWFELRDAVEEAVAGFQRLDSMRRRWYEEVARGIRPPDRAAEDKVKEIFRLWPQVVAQFESVIQPFAKAHEPIPKSDELFATRDAAERIVSQWRSIGPQLCPGLLDIHMTEEAARMDHLLATGVPRLKITPRPL